MALRIVVLVGICTALSCAAASDSIEQQIRTIRQRVDSAFEHHNAKEVATFYQSDGHFSAPTVHLDGTDAIQRMNNSMFSKRPDVSLNHRISRIAVNEEWCIASEQGEWVERWTEKDGVTELRGPYLAVWIRDGDKWRIQSESIVPETCRGGAYCHNK